MKRRDFFKVSAVSTGAFLTGGCQSNAADKTNVSSNKVARPNIVFIFTDDQGWGDLGCYGHPDLQTPGIDRLADEGIRFEQFYANSPVCAPTRAGVMTGQFPSRVGLHTIITQGRENSVRNTPYYVDPQFPMLTRYFQQAGYKTGHFGKWHLGTTRGCNVAASPDEYGIDEYITNMPRWNSWEWKDGKPAESNDQIFDEGIRFIRENKDRPFYLQLWTYDPHTPIVASEEMKEKYKGFSEPQKNYYAVISDIDRNVKRIVDFVEMLGLSEDTLFIYSSDNGPERHTPEPSSYGYFCYGSPGPFRGMKRSLYEGGIRVPLIVRWKGRIKPGQVDKTTVIAGTDFLPSLTSIAGISLPECVKYYIDGEDMSQGLLGYSVNRKTPIIWEYRGPIPGEKGIQSPMMAIRQDEWKLLWNPDDSRTELYNLLKDPTEEKNVASQHSDLVSALKVELQKFYGKLPQGRWQHPDAGYPDGKQQS